MVKIPDPTRKAREARRESKSVDFKAQVDPESRRDTCEVVKDIVAIANSGGGIILFGVNDNGTSASVDLAALESLDPSFWVDKVAAYTDVQIVDLHQDSVLRSDGLAVVLIIPPSPLPIIFTRPGTYSVGPKEQRTAFGRGTVYFRHGAKSEPGTNDDIRQIMDRALERVRSLWSKGIRKVVEAPEDAVVHVIRTGSEGNQQHAQPGRVVADPNAPGFHPQNADDQWPYRQKDVIRLVRERVPGIKLTSHDVLSIRKVDRLEETRPDFVYRPFKKSAAQFSDAFVEWLASKLENEPMLCDVYRDRYKEMARASSPDREQS